MDEPKPPSEPAAAPPKPDVAATDLETIRKTVEDAAGVSGGLWVSYLVTLFYFAVAVSSVTHVDLFLENPVKAPFLNTELPLRAFFTLAPLMFVIIHAYTLVYFVMLSEKAKWYHAELRRQFPDDDENVVGQPAADTRNRLRRRLPGNIFVQFLAGPEDVRESAFGLLLKAIAWSSLVIAPILLLLLMQVKVLPYHDPGALWVIRMVLLVDLVLVWWLWHAILLGRGDFVKGRHWTTSAAPYLGAGLSLVVIWFSWTIATFPGEWLETILPDWRWVATTTDEGHPTKVSLHDALFHGRIDPTSHQRGFLSDTLVIPSFDIEHGPGAEDVKKAQTQMFVFRAAGRDLRGAVFDLSHLSHVDFRYADLEGASFFHTQMLGTWLFCARLERASFHLAEIQSAGFREAKLQGSDFEGADAAGAFFDGAAMTNANLDKAKLAGASFNAARLDRATFKKARLDGAVFGDRFRSTGECDDAGVETADLEWADFTDASLRAVSFKGARLTHTQFKGADLEGADLSGTAVAQADLPATALSSIRIDVAQQGRSTAEDGAGGGPGAGVGATYEATVAEVFKNLTCPGNLDSLHVLRGLLANDRFADVRSHAVGLIEPLFGKDCVPSYTLTDYDRANLLEAEAKFSAKK